MFDKIGRLAEAAANSVSLSRRGFLGRLGKAALGAAGVLVGLLVMPGSAQAGGGVVCCNYECKNAYACPNKMTICEPAGTPCPEIMIGCDCKFTSSHTRNACTQC